MSKKQRVAFIIPKTIFKCKNCFFKICFKNPPDQKIQDTSHDRNKIGHYNLLLGQDIHSVHTQRR